MLGTGEVGIQPPQGLGFLQALTQFSCSEGEQEKIICEWEGTWTFCHQPPSPFFGTPSKGSNNELWPGAVQTPPQPPALGSNSIIQLLLQSWIDSCSHQGKEITRYQTRPGASSSLSLEIPADTALSLFESRDQGNLTPEILSCTQFQLWWMFVCC